MLSNGNCTQIFLSRMSWMKQNLTDAVEKRRKIKPKPPVIWHIVCSARYMLSPVRPSVCLWRYVLEQMLLLRAYSKSYMKNRLVPKWMTLTFV